MSTTEKLIKARMGMLALAEQLNNVSAACRRAGISRSHYYEIKEPSRSSAPRAWRRRPAAKYNLLADSFLPFPEPFMSAGPLVRACALGSLLVPTLARREP
jgi:hypothetical protein